MERKKEELAYKEKFVAFVDILGFKKFVEKSVNGDGLALTEILELLKVFGSNNKRNELDIYGATICPDSRCVEKNLDFQLTQISDCVIISTEVSPAGLINLINHCFSGSLGFLKKGVMCRGYITRGHVYHTEFQIIGTAYQEALEKEGKVSAFKLPDDKNGGTPFIELDASVVNYVENLQDECVKTMYQRMVKSDGGVSVLFPFQRLQSLFGGIGLNVEQELASNDIVKKMISDFIAKLEIMVDSDNTRGQQKLKYYLNILNDLLKECDKIDEMISDFSQPMPSCNINGLLI